MKAGFQRHIYIHPHVDCSITHNSQDMETMLVPSVDKWIKCMWHLYTWNVF